jgi:uncharacterized protein YecE (DUF72 family)
MKTKIGCCGFPVGREKYFRHFSVVEIQKTFYQPPSLSTIEKWRREAPADFEFTLKAWQLITHKPSSPTYRRLTRSIPETLKDNYGSFKPTGQVLAAWEEVSSVAQALRAKIIVFQCPASFAPLPDNKENMRRFFERLDRRDFWFAWEPRGKWASEEIAELCEQLGLIHCVDPFQASPAWGEMKYFRLHGKTGYRYRYTDEDLRELAEKIGGESPCYVMFNNVPMFPDALRFREVLRESSFDEKV